MTLFLSSALLMAAWLALALAMGRHQRDLLGKHISDRSARLFRMFGWGLLLLSAFPPAEKWGMLTGITIWIALMALAAICVVLSIAIRARSPGKAGR